MLCLVLFSFMAMVVLVNSEKKSSSIKNFTALTTLPSISLGVEYFEPVNRFYADNRDEIYVGMRPLSTMDFIYAK